MKLSVTVVLELNDSQADRSQTIADACVAMARTVNVDLADVVSDIVQMNMTDQIGDNIVDLEFCRMMAAMQWMHMHHRERFMEMAKAANNRLDKDVRICNFE
jgi:hypothetical protein